MSRWRKIDFQEVEAEEDQARLLDGYEPVGLVKLDRGRAGPTGRRLERKGLGGSGMGRARAAGYAVTTHARTCSSVARPRTKATLPLAAVRPLHTDGKERAVAGIRALCRAPEFSDAIGDAPRAQWPLAAPPRPPPALGTPLDAIPSTSSKPPKDIVVIKYSRTGGAFTPTSSAWDATGEATRNEIANHVERVSP